MAKTLLEVFNEEELRPGVLPPNCYRLVHSTKDRSKWIFSGHDMGDCEIVNETDDYIALKQEGYSYWWANYQPYAYSPAEYRVFEKIGYGDAGEFIIHPILTWPVRKPKS